MATFSVNVAGPGVISCAGPLVILGPNGSGKTRLAQALSAKTMTVIGAQRQTWIDQTLPVQQDEQLRQGVKARQERWRNAAWQLADDFEFAFSSLVQEHIARLTRANELAVTEGHPVSPITDTKLQKLRALWNRLYPTRQLHIDNFFPRVSRNDSPSDTYLLSHMSDGERSVLYMAVRVLQADQPVILVDEPELHMHSKLAVTFWTEMEALRPDCGFIYITHDLNFALSRRNAQFLIVKNSDAVQLVKFDEVSASMGTEVLGAATLPFYAKRIFFYEGAPGAGFANDFFATWFNDPLTFAIPAGNRKSVCNAVSGLQRVGMSSAQIMGLIDRDYDSDERLTSFAKDIQVLPVHELESVFCDPNIVRAVASHLGLKEEDVYTEYMTRIRSEFQGKQLHVTIARRVRSRIGDLLHNAFDAGQIVMDFAETTKNHRAPFENEAIPNAISSMFEEERTRLTKAIDSGDATLLALLPGKHLLAIAATALKMNNMDLLKQLILKSLKPMSLEESESTRVLRKTIEPILEQYFPSRAS